MPHNTEDSGRLNLAVPVELLARLFATQQLCAADVVALDSASHQQLHRLMLTVCAQQLKGYARQCNGCSSQAICQQLVAEEPLSYVVNASHSSSWRLH